MNIKLSLLVASAFSVVVGLVAHAQLCQAGDIDLQTIGRITGQTDVTANQEASDAKDKEILDAIATSETKRLDPANKQWTSQSPHWSSVYYLVRRDFATDIPNISERVANGGAEMQTTYEKSVASQIEPSDVEPILAYYGTDEGKRFEAFMARIDLVMSSGASSLVNDAKSSLPKVKPSPEQMGDYLRLAKLSHMSQSMIAKHDAEKEPEKDSKGYATIGFIAGVAISKNLSEMARISSAYKPDAEKFEAFEATAPMQKLFKAMGSAMAQMMHTTSPMAELLKSVEDNHKAEWEGAYQLQTSSSPLKPSE